MLEAGGLPVEQARLLARRGVQTIEEARRFLAPTLEQLLPGSELVGFDRSVERLADTCRRGETVAIVGDYDVDGVSSTALLTAALRVCGARPVPLLAQRHAEGYGFQPVHAERAADAAATVLVAVDCGTNSRPAVAAARGRGLDCVVIDHHLPDGGPPLEAILVNPHQAGCTYPFRQLAAAGLTLKVVAGLLTALGREVPWESLLRIACLGTIADVAPLVGENRVIVALGLRALGSSRSPGLRALLASAGLRPPIQAADVGFRLAPRLNAPGRLGTADEALALLLERDPARARELAASLEQWNLRRQALEREVVESARERLAADDRPGRGPVLVWSEGWNRGVVGIAAARLARQLGRPTVLLAVEGESATGSGRSVDEVDLYRLLAPWADRLERFGGHARAIGMTVRADLLPELAREWAALELPAPGPRALEYELELAAHELTGERLARIEALAPFGAGNEEPIVRLSALHAAGPPRRFGQDHVAVTVGAASGGASVELVGWGWGERLRSAPDGPFDVLVRLERDSWRGGMRGRLEALRPSACAH